MVNAPKKRKRIYKKLRNQYRLVIMNHDTYEERASWRLTPMNVFVGFGSFILIFSFLLTYVIAFTPLREYIPGYADVSLQRKVYQLTEKVDALTEEMEARTLYLDNIKKVIEGKEVDMPVSTENIDASKYNDLKTLDQLPVSEEEKKLLEEQEKKAKSKKTK